MKEKTDARLISWADDALLLKAGNALQRVYFLSSLYSSQGRAATFLHILPVSLHTVPRQDFILGCFLIYGSTHSALSMPEIQGGTDISKWASQRLEIEIKLLLAPERRAGRTGTGSCIRRAWRRRVMQGGVSWAFASSTHMSGWREASAAYRAGRGACL